MCSHSLRNRTETQTRSAQSRTLLAGDVFAPRLILPLGERQSYREIQRGMRTSATTTPSHVGEPAWTGSADRTGRTTSRSKPEPLRCSASAGGAAGAQKPRDGKSGSTSPPPTALVGSFELWFAKIQRDVVVCASKSPGPY